MMMKNKELYQQVIVMLDNVRRNDADKIGIFFLGSQLAIGKTRLYKSKVTARNRLITYLTWKDDYNHISKVVDKIEEAGLLEFRKLNDRGARFPYNKPGITGEQANKYVQMLEASDEELSNLAITILQSI